MENHKNTISISGMTCGSCERLVSRAVESAGGHVHTIDAKTGLAEIEYPEGTFEKMKNAITSAGYSLDETGTLRVTESFGQEFKSFTGKLFSGEKELWAERKILKMSLLSLLLLASLGFFLYLFIWHSLPSFASKIPFLAYAGLSAVAITASLSHYRSHKEQFTCMEGMMVGMTIGMMAGFLFGAS